jgi:hypothetical protein
MKLKLVASAAVAVALVLGVTGPAQATVLFDFEGGTQTWWRFGPGTLDFGAAPTEGSQGAGPDGIFYVTSLDENTWGGAVRSPDLPGFGIDMSQYTAFSADIQLSTDNLDPAYPGPVQIELMLNLPGYLEWSKNVPSFPIDGAYHTVSSDFADLVPQNAAVAPITPAQLLDPSLEIRVIVRNVLRDPGDPAGKLRMRVDNVQGIVPEPATLGLLAIGGFTVLRRRRI